MFIADACNKLRDGYLESGLFPSKQAWKHMLQRSVSAPEHHRQLESIRDVCPTLNLDDVLHVDKPSSLWKISRISPKLSPLIATLKAHLGGFLSRSPKRNIIIIMGDFYAKIGDNRGHDIIGHLGLGEMKDNVERFADMCDTGNLSNEKEEII
ncbi:hypothetical protein DPMN_132096 [Dreissena polymorpha]|uniref:Uncharacterized protein n=1 Tax=Dreissena polymorpha TaxID=45954 RepID=A0A9D4FRU1_DREPO|nr:hypothetical protein DPMN_132096 [Dreissena polymorpha]